MFGDMRCSNHSKAFIRCLVLFYFITSSGGISRSCTFSKPVEHILSQAIVVACFDGIFVSWYLDLIVSVYFAQELLSVDVQVWFTQHCNLMRVHQGNSVTQLAIAALGARVAAADAFTGSCWRSVSPVFVRGHCS